MKKILLSVLTILFFTVPMAFAATIYDATANGSYADFFMPSPVDPANYNPAGEASLINDWIVAEGIPMDNNFSAVAKYDYDNNAQEFGTPNWEFTIGDLDVATGLYEYSLKAFGEFVGATVDFALGVKQATGFIAYVWETVTLDISGTFKSTYQGPAYSHVTAFVQNITKEVPEPTTLLLFGAGIAGLAMYRRKRS